MLGIAVIQNLSSFLAGCFWVATYVAARKKNTLTLLSSDLIFEKQKVGEFSPLLSSSEFSLRHLQILCVDCGETEDVQVTG